MRVELVSACFVAACAVRSASVMRTSGGWRIASGTDPNAVAMATYSMWNESVSGFGTLALSTNDSYADADQLYGAGFLEGWLTASDVVLHFDNMWSYVQDRFQDPRVSAALEAFYANQSAWVGTQVQSNASTYWQAVGLLEAQLSGMVDGANAALNSTAVSRFMVQFLSSMGDVLDIVPAVLPELRPVWERMSAVQLMEHVHNTTACTGLIKITGNYSDLLLGHSTWFPFPAAYRIFKHMHLRVSLPAVHGREVSFSSYPGCLYSFDDFYTIWSTGLYVSETTNDILNATLFSLITPHALFAWHRVRVANWMAVDGPSWVNTFTPYIMGAYNNQYQIVNVASFTPGQPLQPDTLWVVEQMPGLTIAADVTGHLEMGYFPSYNVPFFPAMYEYAGYPQALARYAADLRDVSGLKYQLAPRAQILRRDQGLAVDLASFQALMRYNAFHADAYALGNPWNAVCARGDLSSAPNPPARPDGCIDSKAVSGASWSQRMPVIVSGPSTGTSDDPLPPFNWAAWPQVTHRGMPEVYNFTWQPAAWPAWLGRNLGLTQGFATDDNQFTHRTTLL